MKRASISEVKNSLSRYVDLARAGETVVITDRGRPVAQLVSTANSRSASVEERREALEAEGVLLRSTARPGKDFLKGLPPLPQSRGDVLEALLNERAEGR